MPPMLRPVIALESPGLGVLGGERVRLLEAVAREGGISAAARALGISYKHAWDGIAALNNIAGRPLVEARKGGAKGGGAALTPAGTRFITAFRRLEAETAERLRAIEAELGEEGVTARRLLGGVLRTSARNVLAGTVSALDHGAVACTVTLALSGGAALRAVITRESVAELGLFPGRPAIALVKAPFVRLAAAGPAAELTTAPPAEPAAENCLSGRVIRIDPDEPAGVAEVILDIGGAKTLAAVAPLAEAGRFRPGQPLTAVIDPGHVILAVD